MAGVNRWRTCHKMCFCVEMLYTNYKTGKIPLYHYYAQLPMHAGSFVNNALIQPFCEINTMIHCVWSKLPKSLWILEIQASIDAKQPDD